MSGTGWLLPRCEVCGNEKFKLMKEQEASGLLSQLGIKNPLSKDVSWGDILF